MNITALGHAGFCVETEQSIIIIDPWLSAHGAFDCSWFQYPKNQFMQAKVQQWLNNSSKDTYIYISHEHQDHFDIDFLESLTNKAFTLILADFDHPVVKNKLEARAFHCAEIVVLKDEQPYPLKDAVLTLFIRDTEMNCDSAILIQSPSGVFFNINDCKIHDRLHAIAHKYGSIDVFAAQYSGASWYPTCYQMTDEAYHATCEEKIHSKFEATAIAIETLKPKVYIPSAGPPCFLDPLLMDINFQAINTYPRAHELIAYFNQRLQSLSDKTTWDDVYPGDMLDVTTLTWTRDEGSKPLDQDEFESYIKAYAQEKQALFLAREQAHKKIDVHHVFAGLRQELEDKVSALKLVHLTVSTPLYWRLSEYPEQMYCIDFSQKTVEVVGALRDPTHYVRITAPAWQVNKVLSKEMSWPDFALTLRVNLERVPSVYNTLIHGFLMLDPEKISAFCEKLAATYKNKERIIVESEGKKYSILRYCPHQGADLSLCQVEGSSVICPRHQWRFDLNNEGKCLYNETTLSAVCLEEVDG